MLLYPSFNLLSLFHILYLSFSFWLLSIANEMLSIFLSSNAIIIFCFLAITSYVFPSYSKFGSSSFVADRYNVSSSKIIDNPNGSKILSTEPLNNLLEREWPVVCESDHYSTHPVNSTDCFHIATEIENSAGATSWHIYKSTDPDLEWRHGDCYALLNSMFPTATDVFKPILIARNIRRVAEKCEGMVPKMGGATSVGPRRNFELFIEP